MTELFSFDRPVVFNRQREYMLFSNVHETFIGVNFSPTTQNLYILTIDSFVGSMSFEMFY